MAKNIIFCADGTWNGPDVDEDADGLPDITNVLKLFLDLEGDGEPSIYRNGDEQERSLNQTGGAVQTAKYIHGVGDSKNRLIQMLGGAFGSGLIARVVRGYTFISRNYSPGDSIILVGFSRGAYTARALAGFILSMGLLDKTLYNNSDAEKTEQAYRAGAAAWRMYREKANTGKKSLLKKMAEIISYLPGFMLKDVPAAHFIEAGTITIKAVAVWDTVGSLGIPAYAVSGQKLDAFEFANCDLSPRVEFGFHAVSADERRGEFTPTLWKPAANVTQILFAGAHADVGGGYTMKNGESGLSDIALEWMEQQLGKPGIGLKFRPHKVYPFKPDHLGVAHAPWRHAPWKGMKKVNRNLYGFAQPQCHPTIDRRKGQPVLHDPSEKTPTPYVPGNVP